MLIAYYDKCISPSDLNTQQVGIDRGDIPDLSQVRLWFFNIINSKLSDAVCSACDLDCSIELSNLP